MNTFRRLSVDGFLKAKESHRQRAKFFLIRRGDPGHLGLGAASED